MLTHAFDRVLDFIGLRLVSSPSGWPQSPWPRTEYQLSQPQPWKKTNNDEIIKHFWKLNLMLAAWSGVCPRESALFTSAPILTSQWPMRSGDPSEGAHLSLFLLNLRAFLLHPHHLIHHPVLGFLAPADHCCKSSNLYYIKVLEAVIREFTVINNNSTKWKKGTLTRKDVIICL